MDVSVILHHDHERDQDGQEHGKWHGHFDRKKKNKKGYRDEGFPESECGPDQGCYKTDNRNIQIGQVQKVSVLVFSYCFYFGTLESRFTLWLPPKADLFCKTNAVMYGNPPSVQVPGKFLPGCRASIPAIIHSRISADPFHHDHPGGRPTPGFCCFFSSYFPLLHHRYCLPLVLVFVVRNELI